FAVRKAPARHDPNGARPIPRSGGEFLREPGLADSGRALESHERRPAEPKALRVQELEKPELLLPTDHRDRLGPARALLQAHRSPPNISIARPSRMSVSETSARSNPKRRMTATRIAAPATITS